MSVRPPSGPRRTRVALTSLAAVLLAGASAGPSFGQVAAQFNFNSVPPDDSLTTGSFAPSVDSVPGTPAVTRIGGTTGTSVSDFVTADSSSPSFPNNRSSDPATADDTALVFVNFPAQGTGNGTAGFELSADLSLFEDVVFGFDSLVQNSASRFYRVQFSTDGGTTFTDDDLIDVGGTNQWVNGRSFTFDGALDGQDDAVIRVVSEFAPNSTAYVQNAGNVYSPTNGQFRLDLLTLSGTPVPEPTGVAGLALAGVALLRRRRD